ncbi:hypothetical protein SAMD00079811_82150 (plasmid) [Scytonema sp. HK-05]|uniref:hypothetical protein n=1 Tax=Scytonema sp. HK-05 TaxID=1137095 RepID=UPI000935D714|nr:hypothetical protein [Scytonema sp. HK-05]OKH52404.1 hypothetical protein NIES2130_32220 [Scytonema sp. HK-05]BAY50586.1 hypothetical protein SAMD00079811_82150 [Scytonema sp. HK-05]
MGNPRAFEGKREATQFKAAGEEPLIAKIDLKVTETMKQELRAIPGWQAKLRDAIAQLIEAEQCKQM